MKDDLKQQLEQEQASATEVSELLPLAKQLGQLKIHRPAKKRRKAIGSRWLNIGLPALGGLVVGIAVIILSQSVLPSSWLYPVQSFSDSLATRVQPSYRATIMMKRAAQVQQLVVERARPVTILATLADYNAQVAVYKRADSANYAAFAYCKSNLERAAAAAPTSVKSAITASLYSVDTT